MKSAHIYIKGNYIEINANWTDMSLLGVLKLLEKRYAFTSQWDFQNETYTIPLVHLAAIELELRKSHNVFIHNAVAVPAEPVTLRVEYIGACKRRQQNNFRNRLAWASPSCKPCGGSGMGPRGLGSICQLCNGTGKISTQSVEPISYATAWVNNGWNCVFPEKVLREFFPVVEKFDGDFYKALLKGSDLSKEYKKLARQFHPDVNRKRDAHEMFVKLKDAYSALQDPQRRKRYEAGLRFQVDQQEVDVGFRIPKVCGDVVVECDDTAWTAPPEHDSKITVKKIISWNDVYNLEGKVMCSSWNRKATHPKDIPFVVEWIWPGDFEVDV